MVEQKPYSLSYSLGCLERGLRLHGHIHKKRGASLSLVPRVKAFALPGLSKRATPKAPRRWLYIDILIISGIATQRTQGAYSTPHRGVPVALFLTIHRVCEVLTRQNQSVQLRLLCICVYPTYPIRAFGFR